MTCRVSYLLNPFTTGNPFLGTKLLGFSIGRGLGGLKGLISPKPKPQLTLTRFSGQIYLGLVQEVFCALLQQSALRLFDAALQSVSRSRLPRESRCSGLLLDNLGCDPVAGERRGWGALVHQPSKGVLG